MKLFGSHGHTDDGRSNIGRVNEELFDANAAISAIMVADCAIAYGDRARIVPGGIGFDGAGFES